MLYSFLFVTVVVLTVIQGCGGPSGSNLGVDIPSDSLLTGRIIKNSVAASFQSELGADIAANLAGRVGVPFADVWIEELADDMRFHTTTASDGTYLFSDVPPGTYRIIARYKDALTNLTMKCRSGAVNLSDAAGTVKISDQLVETARNVVTGRLLDAAGNALPVDTVLTLWGETFRVGQDGYFITPPLPDSYQISEIFVRLPGGKGTINFTAPFVSDVVPVFLDLTVEADPVTGNTPPSVSLIGRSDNKVVSKINPGAVLDMTAIGSDVDPGDKETLSATWDVTAGVLANGSSDFEKHWTAPDFFGMATVTVEVKDRKGASGKAHLPVLIAIDHPSQADTTRPEVVLSSEVTEVNNSAPFVVRITFNKIVTGFSSNDFSINNGEISNLKEEVVGKIFTVTVTPLASGAVTVTIPENTVQDQFGNRNKSGNTITINNRITSSSSKSLTSFTLVSPQAIGIINETNKTVALSVPFGTNVTSLIPTITHTGSTILPGTGVAQNFTNPVTYTVTATDGTTQAYVVTVTVATNTAKAITAFNFSDLSATGVIKESSKTISLTVPYGTNVTSLIPTITHTGSSVSPDTGVAQNFTNPVTYTVTGTDGSTQAYVVTVTVTTNTAKAITAFNFSSLSVTGVVNEAAKSVALTVPYGTNVTALVPSITHTGSSVSPNTGVAQDFTNPKTYTVTAGNGSTQAYVVTVTVSANTAKSITAFNFSDLSVTGVINEAAKTVALTVPYGTNVTALVPSITYTGSSVSPNTGVAQNFTSPVTYTVTAVNGSTQAYVVTVNVSANTAKAITAFNFSSLSVTGIVSEAAKTVALTVPYGTDVTALAPSITHTGVSVSPNTDVMQNFTNPVTYSVTAANGTTQAYVVTVYVSANTAKAITAFTFADLSVTGVVNEAAKTVALTVTYGTNVTALVPGITHTGSSVSPNTGVAQNF
ncbi:MAG: DUF5018 domain-containing protein, partial [Candidatus Riflebacteria bacterium]|nr:DUF5018 domain-containing protein [Candidatus Riflebacteria bacterium]